MLAQVSARLFDIQTFWVAPGSAQVEKKTVNLFLQAPLLHTCCLFLLILKNYITNAHKNHNIKPIQKKCDAMSILMCISTFLTFFLGFSFANVILIIWHLFCLVAQLVSLLL